MPKKQRVPEVLWRLFGGRARPLLQMIVSLLPPPPPLAAAICERCARCKWRRCLGCSCGVGEAEAASFLLRPDDPQDYRKLLSQCFVVVDDNVPPYSGGYDVVIVRTQRQIVVNVIMKLRMENTPSANVICNGYDKLDRTSATLELLASSAWCLLSERAGGPFMSYLLSNASIFLPMSGVKYCQVAGPPITRLRHKLYKPTSDCFFQHPSVIQSGVQKKRRVGNQSRFSSDGCSISKSGTEPEEHVDKNGDNQISVVATTIGRNIEEATNNGLQGNYNQIIAKDRKRRRPFSWQRRRKKRTLEVAEVATASSSVLCEDTLSLPAKHHCSSKFTLKKVPMFCSCCLQLQAIGKSYQGAQIQRKSVFYNLESSSSGFPKSHELYLLKPDFAGSVSLLCKIFDLYNVDSLAQSIKCFHKAAFCGNHSSCLYHSTVNLLKTLIRRSRSCQYSRLLEKHCAPPLSDKDTSAKVANISEGNGLKKKFLESTDLEDINSYCSKSQVVSFVWAVCRSIVPPELLGTPSNWRILRRNIYKFIELRRFEKFSLKQCLHKLKASTFTFSADPSSSWQYNCLMLQNEGAHNVEEHKRCTELREIMSNTRHKMLERWIYWFFSCLVVPLLRANFYVTESEHGKQEVYYYRKSTWKKLTNGAMGSLTGQMFSSLEDAAVRNIVAKRSYGFSKIRFRPKKNGLRMLVNLKSPSFMPVQWSSVCAQSGESVKTRRLHRTLHKFKRSKSVNYFLHDTYAVLKSLKQREPERLGSTVSDYNDVYRKLCPFLLGLKNGGSLIPPVYVVVSDVVKAFDSVDQDRLLSIMKDVITGRVYTLAESCEMNCSRKSLWVRDKFFSADIDAIAKSFHGVIINQIGSKSVKRQEILFNLNEHIKHNILLFHKKFYLQRIGIPQGSVLSPLLCSFYFGYLEQNVILPFLEKAPEPVVDDSSTTKSCPGTLNALHLEDESACSSRFLLLRFTDDFLFLSTSREQAASLLSRLRRGFREFNCQMNEKKFSVNFDDGYTPRTQSNRADISVDGIQFVHWGGLLLNSCTLEIQADYSRYLNNHLQSTLTVCWQGKPASRIRARLYDFLRPKCHAIFFDSNINSAAVVRLNVYQVFVLCAMKFHCYVRDLSYICKFTPRFYFNIIRSSFRYMTKLIHRRMRTRYLPNIRPVLELKKGEVEWLGLVAYVRVLKRKQSLHKQLLASLRSRLLKHRISGSISPELSYAVDSRHSSVIWKVQY
ncbi:hypothetical protein CDL15_Pgr012738 [Punica granatum]|uniref:Telomerase reverse transcriptase n=1 Tax=Punica granatum TaxID=22663 RepID=A0A218XE79_PUNGR|nr:hypothetical protein CDL15_Pgr012738 [Punica granatum]